MRLKISEGVEKWNSGWRAQKHGEMTKARLARDLGISPARISEYDQGRREPLVLRAIALARALRMRVEDLVEE
jgi:DNA-binding XRE family transcriptional regulator